jgi:phosphohistidine phosphatase
MDLILWRHAEATNASRVDDDMARTLTTRGERQAARMATWLNQHLPATTRVLVSPALRAQQTAAPLERHFKTVAALAPGASVTKLLEAVRWPDSKEPVLVIGHQPTLGQVAAHLMGGVEQTWSIRKGAVWWLRGRDRTGGDQVVLVTVRSPESP